MHPHLPFSPLDDLLRLGLAPLEPPLGLRNLQDRHPALVTLSIPLIQIHSSAKRPAREERLRDPRDGSEERFRRGRRVLRTRERQTGQGVYQEREVGKVLVPRSEDGRSPARRRSTAPIGHDGRQTRKVVGPAGEVLAIDNTDRREGLVGQLGVVCGRQRVEPGVLRAKRSQEVSTKAWVEQKTEEEKHPREGGRIEEGF